ncbi:MAG: dihydrofolate reductase family protein [bacterium]
MGKLIYSVIASLDGYIADSEGNFDWAAPDEEVHAFENELARNIGTYLFGRRMYEVMAAWQTMDVSGEPEVMREYAQLWRASDKVVFSTTLPATWTEKTTLERSFDAAAVRALVSGSTRDVGIGGPGLAASAIKAGLVDEFSAVFVPYIAGGGTQWLPQEFSQKLELVDERRFAGGAVYVCYRPVKD